MLAAPANAIPIAPSASTAPADVPATIARAAVLGRAQDCRGVLALLDPLMSRLGPGKDRTDAQILRMPCLASVGRGAEVDAVQKELSVAAPDNPLVQGFAVFVAIDDGRYPQAADALATLAGAHPEVLATIPSDLWRGLAQKLTEAGDYARRDATTVALAKADWQPADRPDLREALAEDAAAPLAQSGDLTDAQAMLARIGMPELLVEMATERRYAPLWPAIEAKLGAHSEAAVDRFAAERLDAYANNPDDARARRDAVRADVMLGRFDDAIAAAAPVTPADGIDEDDVASLRYAAQALTATGDRAGAIARLRPVAKLDLDRNTEAVAAVVTLAELLSDAGRPADALAVARDADTRGADALSAWGHAWIARSEACALDALGRHDEARAATARLLVHPADNEAAAIEALLCGGRDGEAARLAIATLATPEGADRLTDQFQPVDADWASAPSPAHALWQRLLARADVRAAFDRVARILPRALWPEKIARPVPARTGAPAPDDTTT